MPIQGIVIATIYYRRSSLNWRVCVQGVAEYYHVRTGPGEIQENIVWWYRNPTLESTAIAGYVAFYDDKVDIFVDGEKQTWKVIVYVQCSMYW